MAMKQVGVFYHPLFKTRSYITFRDRLRDFPEALEDLLNRENIHYFECPRVSRELLLKVHLPELVVMADEDDLCGAAYQSAGGVVAAMEALGKKELDRAFCFTGTEGHHAGIQEFWDESCFNDVALALTHVQEISSLKRFAIVDTDAHHAGGTLQVLADRPEVLHLCLCRSGYRSISGNIIEVNVFRPDKDLEADAQYLEKLRGHLPLVAAFRPDLLIWYFGFDTHRDEPASLGLTEAAYFEICGMLAALAGEAGIPLQVVLGGGSLHYVATAVIPEIIRRLAEV
jgi:acetoin utilization deacetylase AcuC-like enzyme